MTLPNFPKTGHSLATEPAPPMLSRFLLASVFSVLLLTPLAFGATDLWAISVLESATALLLALWAIRQWLSPACTIQTNPLFGLMLGFAALVLIQILFHRTAYPYQTRSDALFISLTPPSLFLPFRQQRGSHPQTWVVFTVTEQWSRCSPCFRASHPTVR
jgi:hypothetical protein